MTDLQTLASELLTEVPRATGKLVAEPERTHRHLVEWLGAGSENLTTAETWLAVWRAEVASPTPFEHPPRDKTMNEFNLRRPIAEVIWGKPPGGGVVGFATRGGRWRRISRRLFRLPPSGPPQM